MAYLKSNNIRIAGCSAAVPQNRIDNLKWLQEKNIPESIAQGLINDTGVPERRFTRTNTGLDLSYKAADLLLNELNWNRKEIDALIDVTCFPDYIMPDNACLLQDRLGLDNHCSAYDLAVESSGWIYGLSAIAMSMLGGGVKKALLVTGTGRVKLEDNAQDYMFGHAATATALEFDALSEPSNFYFGTDVENEGDLYVNQNGVRLERDKSKLKCKGFQGDELFNVESKIDMTSNFRFTEESAVKSILNLCERSSTELSDIDFLLLHQISGKVNASIGKRLGVEEDKIPSSISHYGNTGSSSIPLTIVTQLKENLCSRSVRLLCSACGGHSLSAALFKIDNILIPNLLEIEE